MASMPAQIGVQERGYCLTLVSLDWRRKVMAIFYALHFFSLRNSPEANMGMEDLKWNQVADLGTESESCMGTVLGQENSATPLCQST